MEFTLLWLIVAVFFLLIELASPGLFYSLSFAFGAVAALAYAQIDTCVTTHMLVFLGASAVAMLVLRRMVARRTGTYRPTSNVYALVGKHGTVEVVPTATQFGYVKINGERWACRTIAHEHIGVNAHIIVVGIKGSHLIVRAANEHTNVPS